MLNSFCCILFHFYIKPQQTSRTRRVRMVVSYSISTSNHNNLVRIISFILLYLIPFLHQTTTMDDVSAKTISLYLIPFLHQTTTSPNNAFSWFALYLIPFLHQTTTFRVKGSRRYSCILFHFYIKPQPTRCSAATLPSCILFHFYIKPQPLEGASAHALSCILFHFYIKPQPWRFLQLLQKVVSYSISTSNHNTILKTFGTDFVVSYSISTSNHNLWRIRRYFQAHYHLNHILIFNGML